MLTMNSITLWIGAGVLVFIPSALILRIEEVDEVRNIVRSSLGRRKG